MKQRWNHTPSSPEGEEETGLLEGRNAIQELSLIHISEPTRPY